MYSKLNETLSRIKNISVQEERKEILYPLIDHLQSKIEENTLVNINFICTHNSRRSHLGQIWMQTLVYHFNLKNICCYSGGTEATTVADPIIRTLKEQGFEIKKISKDENAIYSIKFSENTNPIIGFSKKYDHSFNPKNKFIAVMVCSSADEGCPVVMGSEKRIAITYKDPKLFDNTEEEKLKYTEKSLEIASELYYVLSKLNV